MFLPVRGSSLTFESVNEIHTSVLIQMKVYESIKSAVYYAVQGRFELLSLWIKPSCVMTEMKATEPE